MDFFLVGVILWGLIGVSLVLFIRGLWKKSWKSLLVSSITFLPMAVYFVGAENWIQLLGLFPLVSLILALNIRKRDK